MFWLSQTWNFTQQAKICELTSSSRPQFSKSITSNLILLKMASSASHALLSSLVPIIEIIYEYYKKLKQSNECM